MKKLILSSALIGVALTCSSLSMERAPLQTGYIYDFGADVDGGGEVSNQFFHISGGVPLHKSDDLFIALSASYQLHSYSFSGGPAGSFVGLDPWNDIHTASLGGFIRWQFSDNWEFFGIPSIRTSGESGAKFGDTLTGGALLGASYKFSDTLTIGPGIGYIGQLEDSASVFPILVIDWKFCDNLSLTTGPIVGASQGPGLAINWQIQDNLRFSFGARSESRRFRINDSITNGKQAIGEDSSIPVFGILTWQASEHIQTSFIAGVGFANDLLLDDSNGKRVAKKDYDASPFIGVNFGYNF